jgi:regulator of sigma E protease
MPVMPFVIDSIIPNKPASSAGFKKDDILLSVNNTPTPTYADAHHIIAKYANTQIPILVLRNKDSVQLNVTPDATAKIGIQAKFEFENLYPTENIDYNLFAAISRGFKEPFTKISEYWKSLKLMALPKVELKDNLGGFYSMGKIMPSTWDWRAFWSITALISVILALMNILPIPMLDGGYIVFLFYEIIVGKPITS